jgi:8-amino-7-oxononanoate synthase
MRSLDLFARSKLDRLDHLSLRRSLAETDRADFPYVTRGGRRLLSFSCNDYLGLSGHPAVKAAAVAAIEAHGAGAGASRLVTGNHPLYAALEGRLAAEKGTDAACVFGSGYLANIGVLGALVGADDLIVIDALAHACLNAGAQLSGARTLRFRHNDVEHAAALLAAYRGGGGRALLVTETVFSMDGDLAPLAELAALAERHDAWLVTDDAHGFGVVDHADIPVPLQMGTLSKALGAYGGYLCASAPVVDLIKTRARPLIYSTALPPACVAAALAALDVIASAPALARAPVVKARRFADLLGLPPAQSPIVPLILGTPEAALEASAALAEAGFLVTAIRPPTVPTGTARLRFAFSTLHPDAAIDSLAATLLAMPDLLQAERDTCPVSS